MPGLFSPQALAPYAEQVNKDEGDQSLKPSTVDINKINGPSLGLYRIGQALLLGSNGFDLGTTEKVMSQGGRELNPLMGHTPVTNAMTKAGLTGLQLLTLHNLAKTHPNRAAIMAAAMSVIPTLAGLHNLKQIK